MKKFLIGTMFMGLASLVYAQNATIEMDEVKLSDVTVKPLNSDYLDKVDESLPLWVITFEKKVSRFNIKESPFFISLGFSKIHFTHGKGTISATYDHNGKIMWTQEWYHDLVLPQAVRNAVYRAYPDYNMQNNMYRVSYNHKKGAKKVFRIHLKKGSQKKHLTFNADGNQI